MKAGIYSDVSNSQYHEGPGLSSSDLKELLKSGAHFKAYKAEGPREQSPEMRLGTLVHILLLEPQKFKELVHIGIYNIRRGKDFDVACSESSGRIVCNSEEYEKAVRIAEAFKAQAKDHPYLNGEKYKLLEGLKENSFYWNCAKTGELLKARPDNITPDGTIVDIKTTSDASMDAFQKSVVQYGYYLSAAHYLEGIAQCLKANAHPEIKAAPKAFVLIAIETKPPYAFQVYYFSPAAIEAGALHVEQALATYKRCTESDKWEGYSKEMIEISLPAWAEFRFGLRGK